MRRALLTIGVIAVTALILAPLASAHDSRSNHRGSNDHRGNSDHHGGGGHGHSDGDHPDGDHPSDRSTTYAIVGDTPYGQPQIENFPNDVAEINANPQVRLVMHLGDIKDGSSECTTPYFEQIRADFDQFDDPFVYTPGDNEWTDCHRANNGGYWPAGPVLNGDSRPARLDEIHRIFFDRPGWTLGQHPQRVETQGGRYVENVLWNQSQVEFGVLDVPGSNNDWAPWFGQPQTSSQIDEVTGRTMPT